MAYFLAKKCRLRAELRRSIYALHASHSDKVTARIARALTSACGTTKVEISLGWHQFWQVRSRYCGVVHRSHLRIHR